VFLGIELYMHHLQTFATSPQEEW